MKMFWLLFFLLSAQGSQLAEAVPTEEVTQALIGALEDEDQKVRFDAAVTLQGIKTPQAQEALVQYKQERSG